MGEFVGTDDCQDAREVFRGRSHSSEDKLQRHRAELADIQLGAIAGFDQVEQGTFAKGSGQEAVERAFERAVKRRRVPEGTRRLLVMQIHPGMPPYTDTAGRGAYWCMRLDLYDRLTEHGRGELRRRIGWEAAKTRVLSILIERAQRGKPGLSNQEIRQITCFSRHQVYRLMSELRRETSDLAPPGRGKSALHELKN